ncbi:MAG TPA: hypothetical protein DCS09_08605 [Porphyromonadaceae bacterium]|nr:hypothetical protein [Porphyromonadaceae bacterium]
MVVSVATIKNHTTHGMSRSKEYNTWCHIKSRCNNKRNKKYKDYGGAGVSVSKEWMNSFAVFLADMGNAPSKAHSIERIDVFGDYCKENCKWALPIEQGRNKRRHRLVEYNGETMPLSQACEVTGVNYRGALYRVNNDKHWMPIPQPPKFTE